MAKFVFFLLALFAIPAAASAAETAPTSERLDSRIQSVQSTFGLDILYKDIPSPEGRKGFVLYDKLGVSDMQDALNFVNVFIEELKKYPPGFFERADFHTIVLVKKHFMDDKPVEGLYNAPSNVIFFDIARRRSTLSVRHKIHHEIYHMIALNVPGYPLLNDPEWSQINVDDFAYSPKMRKRGRNPVNYYAPGIPGFVTEYAMVSIEEDKAEVFACLMIPQQRKLIEEWAKKDERLAQKIDYLKGFIKTFDPRMEF